VTSVFSWLQYINIQMGMREYNRVASFMRNFSDAEMALPVCHKQYQQCPSPLYPLWRSSPFLLEQIQAAATDKYVCNMLCISCYRRSVINSCFRSNCYKWLPRPDYIEHLFGCLYTREVDKKRFMYCFCWAEKVNWQPAGCVATRLAPGRSG
jgi:hypothetical protein